MALHPSFGKLLKHYRDCLNWTQETTAEKLNVASRTYQDWELEKRIPHSKKCEEIIRVFRLSEEQANTLRLAANHPTPEIHNLPFQRNPYFTGRKTHLERLDQMLQENGGVPVCISGLGGIGKTQLALEYAHSNYPKVYRAVLWMKAADKVALEASYLSLARLLELPEKDEHEVNLIVQAVNRWLEKQTGWLLVLDNVDDLQLARSVLPTTYHGHILLTARSQIVGNIAAQIKVEAMEREEGVPFLLRRSGVLKGDVEADTIASDICNAAKRLVEILGGHPLALDQAGAYIEETGTSFEKYIQLYHQQCSILLNQYGPLDTKHLEHPETVFVTFEVSFRHAYDVYPLTADVLRFCSFIRQPDAIPEELFFQDDSLKLDTTSFDKAIAALQCYSLVKRDARKKIISIHRLIQAVIRDTMPKEVQEQWGERVNQATKKALLMARRRSDQAGLYLQQGKYEQAELLLEQVRPIFEQRLSTDMAKSLSNLAIPYLQQGKHEKAEPLLEQALPISEQHWDASHLDTAKLLSNQAGLYLQQGRYEKAEPLLEQALSIFEQRLGANHPDTAKSQSNLAELYLLWGKYEQVEPLYLQALSILERSLGIEHLDTADTLHGLAKLYQSQGKYTQAKPMYQRALAVREQRLGPNHPETRKTRKDYTTFLSMDRGQDDSPNSR